MKTFDRILILLFSCSFMFLSCRSKLCDYYNLSYDRIVDIAQDKKYPICVFVYDSESLPIENFINYFSQFSSVKKAIFDYVDVNQDEASSFVKIFQPQIFPFACIFTDTGKLIDIVPGYSKESVLYINKALKSKKMNYDFHYNGKYGNEKSELITLYDAIIELEQKCNHNENAAIEIEALSDSILNPYCLYLMMKNSLCAEDSLAAKKYAYALLKFHKPEDLIMYGDERFFANTLVDPSYNAKTAPKIQVLQKDIVLENCKKNVAVPIILNISNEGEKALHITGIQTSCTCLDLMSDIREYEVYPDEPIKVGLYFVPDKIGNMYREIFIYSDAYKTPVYRITINANVVQ